MHLFSKYHDSYQQVSYYLQLANFYLEYLHLAAISAITRTFGVIVSMPFWGMRSFPTIVAVMHSIRTPRPGTNRLVFASLAER